MTEDREYRAASPATWYLCWDTKSPGGQTHKNLCRLVAKTVQTQNQKYVFFSSSCISFVLLPKSHSLRNWSHVHKPYFHLYNQPYMDEEPHIVIQFALKTLCPLQVIKHDTEKNYEKEAQLDRASRWEAKMCISLHQWSTIKTNLKTSLVLNFIYLDQEHLSNHTHTHTGSKIMISKY